MSRRPGPAARSRDPTPAGARGGRGGRGPRGPGGRGGALGEGAGPGPRGAAGGRAGGRDAPGTRDPGPGTRDPRRPGGCAAAGGAPRASPGEPGPRPGRLKDTGAGRPRGLPPGGGPAWVRGPCFVGVCGARVHSRGAARGRLTRRNPARERKYGGCSRRRAQNDSGSTLCPFVWGSENCLGA